MGSDETLLVNYCQMYPSKLAALCGTKIPNAWGLYDVQDVVRIHMRDEPHVYFIGSHTGCSCGFPSSIADSHVEYFKEMFDESNSDRIDNIASIKELLLVLDECLADSDHCVLLPLWNGTESNAPKGDVHWTRNELSPDTFVVTEQFRYIIHADPKKYDGN